MKIYLYFLNFTYYSEEHSDFDLQLSDVFYEFCILVSRSNYFHCRAIERNGFEILYMNNINKLNLKYYLI